jgi:hypothetical protein
MVRNDPSPVQQSAWGTRPWPVLLSLLFPLAVLAVPVTPAHSITDFVTCESAKMEAPQDWHLPKAVFRTGDDKFFAWVELKDVSGVHPVEMKVFRPDGTYYGKETQVINETNGIASWWRMAAWWRIKGDGPAQTPGRWKLDLVIDGALQRSIYFKINYQAPALAASVQPGVANSVVPVQTIPSPASANLDGRVCIIEASSDLTHWTPIQTNALPTGLLRDSSTAKGVYRLTLRAGDVWTCVVEVSPDLLNWMPIQTNDFPCPSPLDASEAALVNARFYRAVIR